MYWGDDQTRKEVRTKQSSCFFVFVLNETDAEDCIEFVGDFGFWMFIGVKANPDYEFLWCFLGSFVWPLPDAASLWFETSIFGAIFILFPQISNIQTTDFHL